MTTEAKISIVLLFIAGFIGCSHQKVTVDEFPCNSDRFYLKGKIVPYDGVCIKNFNGTGNISEERTYLNGKLHGRSVSYFRNGQVKIKGQFFRGQFHGKWESWYENGTKKFEIHYKKGKMEGSYKVWSEKGKLIEDKEYMANHQCGE